MINRIKSTFRKRRAGIVVEILSATMMLLVTIVLFYVMIPVTNIFFNSLLSIYYQLIGIVPIGRDLPSLVSNLQTEIVLGFTIIIAVIVIYFFVIPWVRERDTGYYYGGGRY